MIKLTINPQPNSLQRKFELLLANEFGLTTGMMSIHGDGSQYVYPKIEWLWVQYQSVHA